MKAKVQYLSLVRHRWWDKNCDQMSSITINFTSKSWVIIPESRLDFQSDFFLWYTPTHEKDFIMLKSQNMFVLSATQRMEHTIRKKSILVLSLRQGPTNNSVNYGLQIQQAEMKWKLNLPIIFCLLGEWHSKALKGIVVPVCLFSYCSCECQLGVIRACLMAISSSTTCYHMSPLSASPLRNDLFHGLSVP